MKRVLTGGLVAAVLLIVPAAASAHTPAASVACNAGLPYVTADMTNYGAGANLRIRVDGDTILDVDFTGDYQTTRKIGSGYVNHSIQVRVVAVDDPDGSLGYTKTFNLVTPPCKEQRYVAPSAAIGAWCEDPMTRYTLRAGSASTTFAIRWTDLGQARKRVVTVGHGRTFVTGYKHVDGGTTTTVRANGHLLASKRAPVIRWAGPCPR